MYICCLVLRAFCTGSSLTSLRRTEHSLRTVFPLVIPLQLPSSPHNSPAHHILKPTNQQAARVHRPRTRQRHVLAAEQRHNTRCWRHYHTWWILDVHTCPVLRWSWRGWRHHDGSWLDCWRRAKHGDVRGGCLRSRKWSSSDAAAGAEWRCDKREHDAHVHGSVFLWVVPYFSLKL